MVNNRAQETGKAGQEFRPRGASEGAWLNNYVCI
jgi:hypothetical protein